MNTNAEQTKPEAVSATIKPVVAGNIPAELRESNAFLNWKYFNKLNGKQIKCPMDGNGNRKSYADMNIHAPFEEAVKAAKDSSIGLGISLKEEGLLLKTDAGDRYVWCLDLDGFVKLGGEQCDDEFNEILDECASYSEISPSTTGAKVFFLSDKKPIKKCCIKFSPSEFCEEFPNVSKYQHREIEVFSKGLYLTLTGDLWTEDYLNIRHLSEKKLDKLINWLDKKAKMGGGAGLAQRPDVKHQQNPSNDPTFYSKLKPESLKAVLGFVDHHDESNWSDTANALARVYKEEGRDYFIAYSKGDYAGDEYKTFDLAEVNDRFERALRETGARPDGYGINHLVELAQTHPEWAFPNLLYDDEVTCTSVLPPLFPHLKVADGVLTQATVTPQKITETLNDAGNAYRFCCANAQTARYVTELGIWILWENERWKYDRDGQIMLMAASVAKTIYIEASNESDNRVSAALAKWANASLQRSRLEAMVKLSQPSLAISATTLDSDSWKLGVQNGVVDLKKGKFREAKPEDYITKLAQVDYDQSATCPLWLSMLDGCMGGNNELVELLQRAGGYSLSGSTAEQVFFFLHGIGANGKSTFINVLRELAGGYGIQSQPDIIMAHRYTNASGPTPEIARLAGARLVAMVETEDGQRLAESRIKQMTGGDAMTARVLHGMPFDFVPTFKLWLTGNHRPIIRGDDHGIWRRIVLIPFAITIAEGKRDKQLSEKLRAEYPGILNWFIAGCLKCQKTGLPLPIEIQKEVDQYKSDMDLIHQWQEERCILGATEEIGALEAYRSYSNWAKCGGHNPISNVKFAQKLKERGTEKKKTNKGSRYIGIGIRQGALFDE
jgi:P4 family phage/plasmid primase-like protien